MFRFFIQYFDENDVLKLLYSDMTQLEKGDTMACWQVPDTKGHPIYRLGIDLQSEFRLDGSIILKTLDWSNTPFDMRWDGQWKCLHR